MLEGISLQRRNGTGIDSGLRHRVPLSRTCADPARMLRVAAPVFFRISRTSFSTVFTEIPNTRSICRSRSPLNTGLRISHSRGVK